MNYCGAFLDIAGQFGSFEGILWSFWEQFWDFLCILRHFIIEAAQHSKMKKSMFAH